jgi:hypothetical protein
LIDQLSSKKKGMNLRNEITKGNREFIIKLKIIIDLCVNQGNNIKISLFSEFGFLQESVFIELITKIIINHQTKSFMFYSFQYKSDKVYVIKGESLVKNYLQIGGSD